MLVYSPMLAQARPKLIAPLYTKFALPLTFIHQDFNTLLLLEVLIFSCLYGRVESKFILRLSHMNFLISADTKFIIFVSSEFNTIISKFLKLFFRKHKCSLKI
jgi:hypothetical protein